MKKTIKKVAITLGFGLIAFVVALNFNIGAKAEPTSRNVTLSLLTSSEALGENCSCKTGSAGICFRITANGNQSCSCTSTQQSVKDCSF